VQGEFISIERVGQYMKGGNTYFVLQKRPDARFAQAATERREDHVRDIWAGECTGSVCATLSLLRPGDRVALHYEEAQDNGRIVRLYRAADIL
jgi:hypothetical protein